MKGTKIVYSDSINCTKWYQYCSDTFSSFSFVHSSKNRKI